MWGYNVNGLQDQEIINVCNIKIAHTHGHVESKAPIVPGVTHQGTVAIGESLQN